MPRPKARSEDDGLLSVPMLSKILHISQPTLRKLCDTKQFPGSHRIPGTKERRIPATSVARYLISKGIPVPLELNKYVTAYNQRYGISA